MRQFVYVVETAPFVPPPDYPWNESLVRNASFRSDRQVGSNEVLICRLGYRRGCISAQLHVCELVFRFVQRRRGLSALDVLSRVNSFLVRREQLKGVGHSLRHVICGLHA